RSIGAKNHWTTWSRVSPLTGTDEVPREYRRQHAKSKRSDRSTLPLMAVDRLVTLSARRRVPPAVNEPIRSYAPGTAERASLKARLAAMAGEHIEIPVIVDGKEYRTGDTAE